MEYTTERGVPIEVRPVPLLLDKIRQAHPEPPAPTYTEHLAGGAVQDVTITPAMAEAWRTQDPDGWALHADAWAAYQAAVDKRTEVLNDVLWRAVMAKAVVVEVPSGGDWEREQASYGITVPSNPTERKAHYIWTEVIGGTKDILRIMALAAGANLTEEQVADAEASFWDTLQRPGTQ